jgi:lipopolysaccharide/colanic/teichoic acid biosynthesis glycosyltransferase
LIEAGLVGLAVFIVGQDGLPLTALAVIAAAGACIPAALYLADLYDPQVMRRDRSRGARALSALGFAAVAGALIGLAAGHDLPRGALIDAVGIACLASLMVRAALVARPDRDGPTRVLVVGNGGQAKELQRILREEAYGEAEACATFVPEMAASGAMRVASGGGMPVTASSSEAAGQSEEPIDAAFFGAGDQQPLADVLPLSPHTEAAKTPAETSSHPLAQVVPISPPQPAPAEVKKTLFELAVATRADMVAIATEDRRQTLQLEELIHLRLKGVDVLPAHRVAERLLRRAPIVFLRPSDLAFGSALGTPLQNAVKRAFDLMVSAALLICAAPVLGFLAALIKLDSKGPVFYSQERVGRGGKPFRIHKLRSMRIDAEADGTPKWAQKKDPRITRIGNFLRKTRLDEIPQVFAVLRGDMSFVGPRPERPFFVQQLKQQIPFFGLREAVKPGITGWAQIRYPYGATVDDARGKLEYDLYYVEHRSIFLDLAIVFHTVKTVLFGRGAR